MNEKLSALTPALAKLLYRNRLSKKELIEINDYPQIYFVGVSNVKKFNNYTYISQTSTERNNKYSNDDFRYLVRIGDHIRYQYEIVKHLGQGSYGSVVKCIDHKSQGKVYALKIARNEKTFQEHAKLEIRILKKLQENNLNTKFNVIGLLDSFVFRDHMFMVFPLLGHSLYHLIKKNNYKGFSLATCRTYAIQIMQALLLLDAYNIIHCDLKPENIMTVLGDELSIKIIDFGSSCFEDGKMYDYIQSRFYRAPEILLKAPYSLSIDMWSYGCILYEMASGEPLFCGINERDQMADIMTVMGMPPPKLLQISANRRRYFSSQGYPRYCSIKEMDNGDIQLVGGYNEANQLRVAPGMRNIRKKLPIEFDDFYLNLMSKCLEYDTSKRIKPHKAILHEWYNQQELQYQLYNEYKSIIKQHSTISSMNSIATKHYSNSSSYESVSSDLTHNSGTAHEFDYFPHIPEDNVVDNVKIQNFKKAKANYLLQTQPIDGVRILPTVFPKSLLVSSSNCLDRLDKFSPYLNNSNNLTKEVVDRYGHKNFKLVEKQTPLYHRTTVSEETHNVSKDLIDDQTNKN